MEKNKYSKMQKEWYENDANAWNIENRDPVVGSFDEHNNWKDYENLFEKIPLEKWKEMDVLDFATGPGRNIVKYNERFKRVDGVDISEQNLQNAKKWITENNINIEQVKLYLCNGYNLENIQNESYDLVMSTIAFQHICVYEIRKNYLKEFYRILRKGGYISIQMGYGSPSPRTVSYYENYYEATSTNRGCDVAISSPNELKKDLEEIGFTNFSCIISKTGPGDIHPNWIYFTAEKNE